MIDTQDLAQEILAAVKEVSQRHKLDPNRATDCIALTMSLGSVLIALVHGADPEAMAVCVSRSDDGRDDGVGILVTVRTSSGIFDVVMPEGEMNS